MQIFTDVVLWSIIVKVVIGLTVTGLIGGIMWPFRSVHKEWVSLKETTKAIQEELVQQRTNCLGTLQHQGDRQIEILGKVSDTLENIHLSQAEMTGYCKANSLASSCRPRAKKK